MKYEQDVSKLTADELKSAGNEQFKIQNFQSAIDLYSKAIEVGPTSAILFANRSACFGKLEQWENALQDAEKSLIIDPLYLKGIYRKSIALFHLKRLTEADSALEYGISLSADNKELKQLQQQVRKNLSKEKTKKDTKQQSKLQSLSSTGLGLYEDKLDALPAGVTEQQQQKWSVQVQLKRIKEIIRSGVSELPNSKTSFAMINPTFQRLLNENQFQELVFPGVPQELRHLIPQNIQTLIQTPEYNAELEHMIPKVIENAETLLENVKGKGARQGEVMDWQTEEVLKPLIFQEIFGRQLIKMVQQVNRRVHAQKARDISNFAAPENEETVTDQLDEETIGNLVDTNTGFTIQDEFLGGDWLPYIQDDIQRFIALKNPFNKIPGSERKEGEFGEMAWVEPDLVKDEFPALGELLKNLHALPYELNRKTNLRLNKALKGMTMLLKLSVGCYQPKRRDCGEGLDDNGYKVTAIYSISKGEGGILKLEHNNQTNDIELVPDRLVLFRSRHVSNEKTQIISGEAYSIVFWLHGSGLETDID